MTHQLLQFSHDTFRERFSECPVIHPSRDAKLLSGLLKVGQGEEKLREVWRHYLGSADAFVQRRGYDIPTFSANYQGVALALDRGETHGETRQHSQTGARRHLPSPASEFGPGGPVEL